MMERSFKLGRLAMLVMLLSMCLWPTATLATRRSQSRVPVVLFPAFHFTKLKVTVTDQHVAAACPRSGTFQDWYQKTTSDNGFSQVCQDQLLTLVYDSRTAKPMAQRFRNQSGVSVAILNYGTTESTPFYETLYRTLEMAGYIRNHNIRVAGYDSRLTPDMGGFLQRTKRLIEATYRANGHTPVHLVGHSNGPLYAQYLLTHTSQAWKNKYIHGFTPIAGNWPGQGILYGLLFTGLNVKDFGFPTDAANARSSASMYLSHPSTYMSAATPAIFGTQEVVVKNLATSISYTPRTYRQLLHDAGLTSYEPIAAYYIGFVKFANVRSFPNVDVYAEKGSGLPTPVGMQLPNLQVGQVIDASGPTILTRDGDTNQEDITNDSVRVWRQMPCFHFSLTDNHDVDHFSLPSDAHVLQRLATDLKRPKSVCR